MRDAALVADDAHLLLEAGDAERALVLGQRAADRHGREDRRGDQRQRHHDRDADDERSKTGEIAGGGCRAVVVLRCFGGGGR
jgi:hypothetical protein